MPFDWNVVKYLNNPEINAFDKFDEQTTLQNTMKNSAMDRAYRDILMQKAKQEMANEEEIAAAMSQVPSTGDPQKDLLAQATLAATMKARRGDLSGVSAVMNSVDPMKDMYRQLQMQNIQSQIGKREQPKEDKNTEWIEKKATGQQMKVSADEVNNYLKSGWKKLESGGDGILEIYEKIKAKKEGSAPNAQSAGGVGDNIKVGQKAYVNGKKAVWNGSSWDYVK